MDSLPIQYLHLETIAIPLFLAMVLFVQLARSSEGTYYISQSRKQWMMFLVGFVVLSLAFGILLARVSPLLAGESGAGFTLSFLHPVNALCFFVHLLFLRPWEIITTNALLLALPRVVALVCVFSWLLHPAQKAKPNARTFQALILLLVFSFWLFLTTFRTPNIVETQSDWFKTYFKSLVIFVMSVFFIESETSITQFTRTLVISALALIIIRLVQYHTEGPTVLRLESGGLLGDPNDLASFIVMALPFALVPVFGSAAHLGQQVFGILFAGLSLLVIWYAQSRGAMLAIAAQVLTAGYHKTRGKNRLKLMLLFGFLGVVYWGAVKAIPRDPAEMEASSEGRITYWKTAVHMTLRNPIFGVGFAHYPANYDRYSVGTKYEWGLRTAHSSWFLAFAESGVIGGTLFITFFGVVLRAAWRNRERWPEQFYAVVGYGLAMSFLSHTYVMYIYLLAGLILASDSLVHRSSHEH